MKTLNHISTATHGYLKVSKSYLNKIKYPIGDISSFSGHNESFVYLEEDQDASNFTEFLTNNNIPFKVKEFYQDVLRYTHNFVEKIYSLKLKEGLIIELDSETGYLFKIKDVGRGSVMIKHLETGILYKISKPNLYRRVTDYFESFKIEGHDR